MAAHPGDGDALAKLESLLGAADHRLDAARALRTLQQPHLVFAALTRALESSPADPTLHQQAEEVAVEVDAVDALVEVLAEHAERATGVTRAAIELKLASLSEQRLSNPEGAIIHLRAAAAASPRDVTALEALRRLHLQRKEWAALAEVLEKVARLHATLDDQIAAWRLAGQVHEEHLLDEESSLACWLRVLDLAPDDREALEAVQGLATALDRPVELARALGREKVAATGERKWTLAIQLAELQATRLNLPGEAIALAAEILAAVPKHPEARALLQRFVAEPSAVGAAAVAALASAFEKAGEGEAQLELLEARLEKAPSSERAGLQQQVEQLAAKLPGNPTQALLKGLKAFGEGRDRLQKLPTLLKLAEQADAIDELAEAVEAASEEAADDGEIAELLRFAAGLRERLKQTHAASVLWNDVLAIRHEDGEALEHLFKLFKQEGEAKSAAEVGLRRARLAAGPDRLERLLEAAALYEDAGVAGKALDALEEALELAGDVRVLRAINRLLAGSDVQKPALQARVLDALAKGGGVTQEAIAGLQKLLGSPARIAAAQALEPLHRERKETRALAEVLEVQLEGIEPKAERVARLTEIASLWETASEPRLALSARLRAFGLSSGEENVRAELARLAATLGAEDELLAAYEDKLERGLEPNPAALWRKIAEHHDTRGQREPATVAWEKAVAAHPSDLVLLRAYAERCRAQGDLPRLAMVLKRQVEATAELPRRHELLVELARLAEEQLADAASAAWAIERLSEQAPKDRSLLASLARLYERCGENAKWADAIARELQLAREAGSADEAALALRLAQLKLEAASDDAGAFELLRDVLRLQPANAHAVTGLVKLASTPGPVRKQAARLAAPLLETRGDNAALVELLTAQVAAQADPTERAVLWGRLSDLHSGRLGDPDSAFLAAARALREVPQDPALLQRCVVLAQGNLDELAALLDELGNKQPPGPARAELFRALGRTQETAGDAAEAIAAWTQVQGSLPSDPEAQKRLQVLLDQAGRHAELATLLQQRARSATATERPAALLALAQAHEKLGQLDAASDTLLTLYTLDPGGRLGLEGLAALERVLGKLGRHRERAEVLGRLAAAAPDERGKHDRLLQQAKAQILAGEVELATGLLTDVLRAAPREDRAVTELVGLAADPRVKARVAAALEPVYRDPEQRWQRLAVLEVLITNADSTAEATLRTELAALYEAMGEHRQAFVERLRLVRANVEDARTREETERVALAAQLEEELVGAYEDLLEKRPSPPVALALSRTIARLYSGRLASPEPAAKMWEEVARLDPESLEPLDALVANYREAKSFAALAQVLRRQVKLLPRVDAQLAALTELAKVAEDSLGDFTTAASAWRDVLQRSPSNLSALTALTRVLERLSLHDELADVLKRRLKIPDQPADAIADVQVKLGQLSLGPLKQPDAALSYFEQALHSRPDEAAAVAGLEALLVRAPLLRAPTGAILEAVYRARNDLARLAEALELQLPGAVGARELALLEELSALREGLGDPARAYLARAEVFKRTPSDARVRTELERLAEATGKLEDLTAVYRAQLATSLAEPLTVDLWRTVAATHQRLGQRKRAAEAWEEVSKRRPAEEPPLIALCGLYREEQDFAQLPRLLRHRAELQPAIEDQVALLLELVDVAELQLNDPALAIESSRLAFSRAPEDRQTLAVLERLLETHRHFDDLAQLLQGQVRRAEELRDEPLELTQRVKLARIKHRGQDDGVAAVELLRGVLGRRADHADALTATADIMRAPGPAADSAAALLEPLFLRAHAWKPLLEVLSVRANLATGQTRASLLHQVADLQEHKLEAPGDALQTLADLLRESPGELRALQRILALGPLAKAEERVAALLAEVLPNAGTDAVRSSMLRPLALLYQQLGSSDAALERWRQLLLVAPTDDEALSAAIALLETAWRWGELVAVLEARLPHARDDAERVALHARIGAVREDSLSDARGAYTAFRHVLELSSQDVAAMVRLDRLSGQLQLWTEQAEFLARRIRVEPQDAIALRLRLAEVRRTRLQDRDGALPLLAEVLQSNHSHPEALTQLEQLLEGEPDFGHASELLLGGYRHLGDVKRLSAFLESRSALAAESLRRRALWLELARLRLEREDDPQLGFLAMARAYKETPRDASLRAQLIELAAAAESQDALAAVLEEVLPALDREGVAQASLALGALYEGPLKDPEAAALAYRRALDTTPTVGAQALAGLDRVLEGLGRWAELLPVLEACLVAARSTPERVGLLLRIAAVADERLGQPDRAAAALREVLELEPSHVAGARTLEALYERTGQAELQVGALEHLLLHVPPLDRQAVRLKLAGLCSEKRPERAIALGRELLADDPLHVGGFTLLLGHYQKAKRHDELGKLLRARRAVTLDPNEVASLEFQLGELAYRQLGQSESAILHYREVLERSRTHKGALTALVEIYEAMVQKPQLAQALGELADSPEAAGDRRLNLLRRAEVLVELGARDLALAAARTALDLNPDSEPELLRFRAVFVAYDALPELARTLVRLSDAQLLAKKPADAVKTLLELARARDRLDELPLSAAALQKVLSLDPSNRSAFDEARTLYGRTDAWVEMAKLLAKFLPHLQSAELPVTLDELAEIYETQLDDTSEAFSWACQAVKLDPTPTSRRTTVERLASALKLHAELAELYQQILEALAFGPTHERLALSLAAVQDVALDQVDAAEKTLLALLAHDPANPTGLEALVKLFARRGLHLRQAGALELKLEATTAQAERAALLRTLALLHEEKLKEPRAAAHALRRLVELTHEAEAAGLLAALHRRHQQWPEALEALTQMVKLSPAAARAGVQLQLAALSENELKNVEGAIAAYAQALVFDPASTPAFVALHRLYKDRPVELLRALEQRLTLPLEPDEQVTLLYEAAELWEHKGASLQADQRLERILKARPKEERALEGLQRLRRAGERWTGLADAYARHVEVAQKPLQKATLCGELGTLSHLQLRDDEAAVRWWRKALEHVPEHRPAFVALAELHQLHGRWLEATRMIDRDAQLEKDPHARAALSHRSGLLLEDKLRDVSGATAAYQRALTSHATHLPSLRKLRAIYQREGNWPGYEQTLAQEGEHAPTPVDRAAASLELARHLQTRAKDSKGAIRWYEHTLVDDPQSLDAALPLTDLLVAGAEWRKAAQSSRALIALLERAGPGQRGELVRRLSKLGDVERELGHIGLSLQTYEQALKLDGTEPGALRGCGELFELAGRAVDAGHQYELLLKHHEKTLTAADRAELRVRLTRLFRALGENERATAMVEKALDADPVHPAALRLAIELSDLSAAWEKATLYRQRLAGVAKGDERYQLLVEMGKLAQDKLNKPTLAITGYTAALELKPDSLEVLERIHVAYRSAGQLQKCAQLQETLIAHPLLPEEARQTQTVALAELLGGTLREVDRAITVLEGALDRSPQFGKALQLLESLLIAGQRWKTLDEVYQRLILRLERVPSTAARRAVLWRTLGDLRARLKDEAGAFEAYVAGARLAPEDAVGQEALADFAIAHKEHESEAIAAYVRAIPRSPQPGRICAVLARVAEKRGDLDSMVLAAGAVTLVGTPGPDEVRMLREYSRVARAPAQLRAPVSEAQWQTMLLHPSLRGSLGQLMALIHTQAGPKYAAELGDFKLHPKKHRIELTDSKEPALNNLRYVARTLGFEGLNVYSPFVASRITGKAERHPDEAVGLRVNPTSPLSLFVGEPLLREADLQQLTAHLAATVTYLRPELGMALLLPPEGLLLMIEAALTFGDPGYAPAVDPKLLKNEQKRLGKALSAEGKTMLTRLASNLLRTHRRANSGSEITTGYLDAVRHTAARAALLVTGDFAPVQARVLPMQSARAQLFVRELMVFAVGGDLHALRIATGSQVTGRPT